MALREVTVEVVAKYTTKVIAGDATEAQKKAKKLVVCGCLTPYDTEEIILDVQPINGGDVNDIENSK